MYKILTGKQRGLVFPVMCNGHLKIDYSDNVPNSTYDIGYGIFSHENSFTLETILTPFDVNGDGKTTHSELFNGKDRPSEIIRECTYSGSSRKTLDMSSTSELSVGMRVVHLNDFSDETYITEITSSTRITVSRDNLVSSTQTNQRVYFVKPYSKKIMPSPPTVDVAGSSVTQSNYQSSKYLTNASRITHEMMLFYSSGMSLSLLNNTNGNVNQPAEYKIKVALTVGGTTTTLSTNNVITGNVGNQFFYSGVDDKVGFDTNGIVQYQKITTFTTKSSSTISGLATHGEKKVAIGEYVYIKNGDNFIRLGRVTSVGSSSFTLTDGEAYDNFSGVTTDLYIAVEKDASYINQQYHIGCSFNSSNKTVNVYLNGTRLKLFDSGGTASNSVSGTGSFSFGTDDIYMGSVGNSIGEGSSTTNKQFMGILHELSIVNIDRKTFNIRNLLPNYDNTLLFLRFEEIDI